MKKITDKFKQKLFFQFILLKAINLENLRSTFELCEIIGLWNFDDLLLFSIPQIVLMISSRIMKNWVDWDLFIIV